jgi:hypothetical protein
MKASPDSLAPPRSVPHWGSPKCRPQPWRAVLVTWHNNHKWTQTVQTCKLLIVTFNVRCADARRPWRPGRLLSWHLTWQAPFIILVCWRVAEVAAASFSGP